MGNDTKYITIGGLVLAVLIIGAVIYSGNNSKIPGKLDDFATCLTDSGAKFYGAFWCPHCAEQKKLFGSSVKKLPYVECSTLDTNGQTPVCIDNQIESYPTWQFAKGITVKSDVDPIVCEKQPGVAGEDPKCEGAPQPLASKYFKKWIFPTQEIVSNDEPVVKDHVWQFASSSLSQGGLTLDQLSAQTSCALPTE